MPRSVPEWIGATPDTPVPLRVRLRVFAAQDGRCEITGRKITPADKWECDHRLAVINGGENRERNLRVILKDKHKEKTADDVAIKAKTDRIRAKHLGTFPKSKHKIRGRGFGSGRNRAFGREAD